MKNLVYSALNKTETIFHSETVIFHNESQRNGKQYVKLNENVWSRKTEISFLRSHEFIQISQM